jgi:hypothetical protein
MVRSKRCCRGHFGGGVEADYLQFNSGTERTIGVAEKQGILVP